MQDKLVRSFVRHQLPYQPLARKLFRERKLRFTDIRSIDDLQKLPFTSKQDMLATKKNAGKHRDVVLHPTPSLMRGHASLPTKLRALADRESVYREYRPVHLHFTTGRSANSVPVLYTAHDMARLAEGGRRLIDVIGARPGSTGINAFPYAPHLAFWQLFAAVQEAGILALHSGGGKVLGTTRISRALESMQAELLAGMPGYVYHLLRTASRERRKLGKLELVIFGGERVPPGLRAKIRQMLRKRASSKLRVLATYAFTEGKTAWGECTEDSGYHLYPDLEFIELVDKNGERVGEGEKGEIVYTSLDWRGSVFTRYRTGDVCRGLYRERCPHCRRTVPRLDGRIERESEHKEFSLTKIKGSLVNLNAFFSILGGSPEVEEWQVELRKKNDDPYEVDELVVRVAPKKKVEFPRFKRRLEEKILEETEVSPKVVKTDLPELLRRLGMEEELKERRIVDNRP